MVIRSLYNKRGLSELITTILMIAMVMGLAVVVWGVSRSLVNDKINQAQSCFGNFNQITISKQYTCINSTSTEVKTSLSVGDVTIDGILVSISGASGAKSFTINNGSSFSYVKPYGGSYGNSLTLPTKNSALTYLINYNTIGILDADSITIAPVINGKQCDVSDSLSKIDSCLLSA